MVIDTSALIAIFLGEPEADRFDEAIAKAKTRLLPATCLLEARMALVARRDERSVNDLDLWLLKAGVDVIPGRLRPCRSRHTSLARLWQGPPSGRAQFRGLPCLRFGETLGIAATVQGRRFLQD
jgi:uncharacterized protein with PIN domain